MDTPLTRAGPHARRALFVGFAIVLLSAPLLWVLEIAAPLDRALMDQQFRLIRDHWPKPAAADVVIVGIDEATTASFSEPIALWHPHLGALLKALSKAGPRAVGLDISLPDRSYDFLLPGHDRKLLEGIVALRDTAPIVLGLTVDAEGRLRRIHPPFISAAGRDSNGFVLWPLDADRVVRRFEPALARGGEPVPTLVGQLAKALDLPTQAGLIDYGIGASFTYVPMQEILDWDQSGDLTRLQMTFANRVILIGSVLPFIDRHYQPVELAAWEPGNRFAPGVLLHAQTLRSIMGPGLVSPTPPWLAMVMAALCALFWWVRPTLSHTILVTILIIILLITGSTIALYHGYAPAVMTAALVTIIAGAGRLSYAATILIMERRWLRRAFTSYVSPHIMAEIMHGRLAPILGGERKHICVLFADMRGFSARAETMRPEEAIDLLNRYFECLSDAVHSHNGTLDKFIGDGVMAFFGAPNGLVNPSQAAFDAAREMFTNLAVLNKELARENVPDIEIGIGIDAGEAVVGHVGSSRRNEYTAIGDVVNVASRIENLTKSYPFALLCTESVMADIEAHDDFVDLGPNQLSGHTPVHLFGWSPNKP